MNSTHIQPQHVKRAFSKAVSSYDQHAVLQREIGDRLIAHLNFTKIAPKRILDIGCGTGYFTRLLRQRFKQAEIVALDLSEAMVGVTRASHARRLPWHGRHHHLCAHAAALPIQNASFDLVCSNLAMQWLPDPQAMLAEMRRVLAPEGLILFSTFGRRTLTELRQTLATIDPANAGHVLPFPDVTSLGDALMQLAVEQPVTDSDIFTLTYPDSISLIRELKGLGASAAAIRGRKSGLYGRAMIRQIEAIYSREHSDASGKIRATFEALYGQAWYKPEDYAARGNTIPIRAVGDVHEGGL